MIASYMYLRSVGFTRWLAFKCVVVGHLRFTIPKGYGPDE